MDKMLRDFCLREILLCGSQDDTIEVTDLTILHGVQSAVPMLVTGAYIQEMEPGHWYLVVEVDIPETVDWWMENYVCFEICYLERKRIRKDGGWKLRVL